MEQQWIIIGSLSSVNNKPWLVVSWAGNENSSFPEFLATQGQYLGLQEYSRLTRDWCQANRASQNFLLGLAYLNTGEPLKAEETFLRAIPNLGNEEFLLRLLQPEDVNQMRLEMEYYLKVRNEILS